MEGVSLMEVGERIEVRIKHEISDELLDKFFPKEYCKGRVHEKNLIAYEKCNWWPNITQFWYGAFNIGDACIIPVYKNDIGLNQLGGML